MTTHKAPRARALWSATLLFLSSVPDLARAEVVTLAQLEAQALQNRPALAREGARTRAAEAELRKAASAYYPQFMLKADSSLGPGRQLIRVGSDGQTDRGYLVQGAPPIQAGASALRPFPRTTVELSGTATLYDFGRTQAATFAGKQARAAALASSQLTEEELRNAVREGYLAWLLSSELARLSQLTLQDAEGRRARVEALVSEGVRPSGELSPARADELLAKLEGERAQHDLASARLMLELAVGSALAADAEPDLQLLDAGSQLPDQSETEARSRRALLARFKAAKAAADAQSKLNRPQLGIGATVGLRVSTQRVFDVDRDEMGLSNTRDSNTTVFPLYGAGLTLTVPLWDGGYTSAASAAAQAQAEEVKADLDDFEAMRGHEQSKAELDARHAQERLHTATELVTVCQTRLQDAQAGFDAGVATLEQVAQARAQLRRAETEALLARVDHAAARLRMSRKDAPKQGR